MTTINTTMAPLTVALHAYYDVVCQTKELENKAFIALSLIWDFYNSHLNFQ